MRCLLSYIIICVALLAATAACSSHCDVQLDAAESLIGIDNDSALSILDSLTTQDLDSKLMARYAYLRSKAEYRKHGCPLSDSLVELAAEYYYGTGDSIEAQTAFLRGIVCSYAGSSDSALVFLHHAYDLAAADSSWFYAGVSARELSRVYCKTLLTREELKWGLTAKECFAKGNLPVYANWMDFMLIRAYERNRRYDDALEVYAGVDSVLFADAPYFRQKVLVSTAEVKYALGEYADVIDIYKALEADGYEFDAYDNFCMSSAYLSSGDYAMAEKRFENAAKLLNNEGDSINYLSVKASLLEAKKDYKAACELLSKAINRLKARHYRMIAEPRTLLLAENMKLKAENENARAERNATVVEKLIIAAVALLIILTLIFLYMRLMLAKRKTDIAKLVLESKSLKDELGVVGANLDIRNVETEKLRQKHDKLYSDINALFSQHINLLDKICNAYYTKGNKSVADHLHKRINSILNDVRKIDVSERLAEIVDFHANGWMSRFKSAYPGLNDGYYLLAMYLYLGLSMEAIAVLTGRDGTPAV
ncbi:MAG: tetratricopeptide repeat protein, partial [Paramuribaculum sp.]|nr:tetratricopeptide repeat protein [Paramuribaculum sp.]